MSEAKPEKVKASTPAGPCPYCSAMVDLGTSAKKKCPSCGEQILSRTDPETNARVMVTEKGAADLKQKDEDLRAINFALKKMGAIGYSEQTIRAKHAELLKAMPGSKIRDAIWAIAQDEVDSYTRQGEIPHPRVYLAMAAFLEWEGRDGSQLKLHAIELWNKLDNMEQEERERQYLL